MSVRQQGHCWLTRAVSPHASPVQPPWHRQAPGSVAHGSEVPGWQSGVGTAWVCHWFIACVGSPLLQAGPLVLSKMPVNSRGPGCPRSVSLGEVTACPQWQGQHGCSVWLGPAFWGFLNLCPALYCPCPNRRESPPRFLTRQRREEAGGQPAPHSPSSFKGGPGTPKRDRRQGRGPPRASSPRAYACPCVTQRERQGPGPVSIHGAHSPGSRYR